MDAEELVLKIVAMDVRRDAKGAEVVVKAFVEDVPVDVKGLARELVLHPAFLHVKMDAMYYVRNLAAVVAEELARLIVQVPVCCRG